MSSIEPLVNAYSFNANRTQATDMVDLTELDAVFSTMTAKLNECIAALDVTLADDDTLADSTVTVDSIASESWAEIVSIAQGGAAPS